MGGVFARGFLRQGHPVHPVTRGHDLGERAARLPEPELVLVAVAENDLHDVLARMPAAWRDRLVLLQNELLPQDWRRHGLATPTVISVWFEKKPGQDVKVLIPSPALGPHAILLHDALATLDIPVRVLDGEDALLFELVLKNVYILTTNIAGLVVGGNVGELWSHHRELAREVAAEVIRLQSALTGRELDADALVAGMVTAFEGDPEHRCMGRSARARLERALQQARDAGLELEKLEAIAAGA